MLRGRTGYELVCPKNVYLVNNTCTTSVHGLWQRIGCNFTFRPQPSMFGLRMTGIRKILALTVLIGAVWPARVANSASASTPPSVQEVYELLQTNLPGVHLPELKNASVEGLLKLLGPRVELVSDKTGLDRGATTCGLVKTNLFDGAIAYFRIAEVTVPLASELLAAIERIAGTNKLSGIVLDLRFASGTDYAAAASVADLFASGGGLLLDWGGGQAYATAKTNAIKLPVMALVNGETAGAAQVLAALVRQLGVGLVIGTNTAGRICAVNEFELSTGQRLRISGGPVKLGDGQALPEDGLQPDIAVAVRPEDERAFLDDPYRQITTGQELSGQNGGSNQTNRVQRRRINEAELMREYMEGSGSAGRRPAPGADEPAPPVVTDPVLARALDLIKGLAVLQQTQDR